MSKRLAIIENDAWLEPVEGEIKVGDKVIVSGMSKLVSGMKVQPVEATNNDDLDPNFQPRIKE